MGAPPKGQERTQQEIRAALVARNKARRKYQHYLGPDEQGRSTYRAPCGHVVLGPRIPMCWECRQAKKTDGRNEFIGRDEKGWSWFRARDCGHVVHGARTKQCRKCWIEKRDSEAQRTELGGWKSNPYRRVIGVGTVKEHRVIAEQTLGRKLKPNEVVHHINMDKTDNRRLNLLICTKDYHRLLHYRMQLATAHRIRAQQGVS